VSLQVAANTPTGTLLPASANLYDSGASVQSYARAESVATTVTPPGNSGLLSVAITATPDPVLPGQTVSYQITVTNIGGAANGSFGVYFTIPPFTNANPGSATPGAYSSDCGSGGAGGCTPGQTVYWSAGSGLAAGATTTFQLGVTVDSSGAPNSGFLLNAGAVVYNGVNGAGSVVIGTSTGSAGSFNPINYASGATDGPMPPWAVGLLGLLMIGTERYVTSRRREPVARQAPNSIPTNTR
jgi:uncharacterized repeat protein (TIGR01451 family)